MSETAGSTETMNVVSHVENPFTTHSLFAVFALLILLLAQGCASQYRPVNQKLAEDKLGEGYKRSVHRWRDSHENVQIFMAFSGGGTRAAALSYGVLTELRETSFISSGEEVPLLPEVDSISAVSGGSFTAAYYGLYGERIFQDYEKDFLKKNVQSSLIRGLLNPVNWWRILVSSFDRTEIAIEYYDRHIFSGATIGDLTDTEGPFITINSTDLTTGNRFSFIQPTFDMLCSDVDSYPISRAVTASSAVPVLFNPIVLKNFSGECHTPTHELLDELLANPDLNLRQKNLVHNVDALRDSEARPYVHLVDGGISDNLGLRALVDWTDILGAKEFTEQLVGSDRDKPRDVALILVNAARVPQRNIDKTAKSPSTADMLSAVTDAQMLRYTLDTQMLIQEMAQSAEEYAQEGDIPVNFHIILLSFKDVNDSKMFEKLNAIKTTLELPEEYVDELISAGRSLLRNNEDYIGFLDAINRPLSD